LLRRGCVTAERDGYIATGGWCFASAKPASVPGHRAGFSQAKTPATRPPPSALEEFFFGGRCNNEANLVGLHEIAVFDRVLSAEERKPKSVCHWLASCKIIKY
jgi:hypothetical protein